MSLFTSAIKSKRDFLSELNYFVPDLSIKKTTLRLLYALLNVKNNKDSLKMNIKISPMGITSMGITPKRMDPFILTDDNIFDLLSNEMSWVTVVQIKKTCLSSNSNRELIRQSCCEKIMRFVNIFNATISPVLSELTVPDLLYCSITLIYKDNSPQNFFKTCLESPSKQYYSDIDAFLRCWNSRQSITAEQLVAFLNDPVMGGRKRTRRRRQKRVRSRSRVRQPRRRRTK